MADEENVEEEPVAAEPPAEKPAAAKPARAEKAVAKSEPAGEVAVASGPAIVIARPAPVGPALPSISRRTLLGGAFWIALGGVLTGIAVTIINTLWPRGVLKLGGTFVLQGINANDLQPGTKRDIVVQVPNPATPLDPLEAKIFLVRFDAEQAARNPGAQEGAILALSRKCPHLGCTVPFVPTFSREDPASGETYPGWFLCPCHGSTYSDAGRRVFGPAPRSMDVYALTIDPDGTMTINLDDLTKGTADNGALGVIPPSA